MSLADIIWLSIGGGLVLGVLAEIGKSKQDKRRREEEERRHRELLEAMKRRGKN
jgi:hypothetical protein